MVVAERSFWVPLIVAGSSLLLFTLDAGLMAVALPSIETRFPDTSRAALSWVVTGYSVATVALLLVAGRLGDRLGRRRVFVRGLVGFAAGALLTGLATSPATLIAGRLFQGAGGALLTATALALVIVEVPHERRAAAMGVWGAIGAMGAIAGPTVGALLVDAWGWRAVFLAIVPLSLAALIAAIRYLPESPTRDGNARTDLFGAAIASVGIAGLALALSQGRTWGFGDPRFVVALVVGMTLIALAIARVGRLGSIIDRRVLADPPFAWATAAAAVQQLGFLSWFVSMGLVFVEVWGWSTLRAGFALSFSMVIAGLTSPLTGRVTDRFGFAPVISIGAALAGAGAAWWAATFETTPDFLGAFLPGALLFGVGAGISGIQTTGAALHYMPNDIIGSANATHSTMRRLASALGVALLPTLLGEDSGPALLDDARTLWIFVGAVHLAMIPPMIGYGRAARRAELARTRSAASPLDAAP